MNEYEVISLPVKSPIRKLVLGLGLAIAFAGPVSACRLALALTIDVSGSIDPAEYRFQMDGLAEALDDPDIKDALVLAQAAVMVCLLYTSDAADE